MRLHVANLSPKVTEQQLQQLFAPFGQVLNIQVNWVETAGRTAGSAIVEMHSTEAMAAITELNGRAFRNRRLYITPISDDKANTLKNKKPAVPGMALKKGTGTT
jgi:RNA recognition motif-containing protein